MSSTASSLNEIESPVWLKFLWLHTRDAFREHYFNVHFDNRVRLYDNTSDSGLHGRWTQITTDTFVVEVHYKGDRAGFLHTLHFRRSELYSRMCLGYECGEPHCTLTMLDD